ncbi:MAG: AbrB/MazE/SpoVT family DNA-binding domain-containing protein, partial [Limnospira sp.]
LPALKRQSFQTYRRFYVIPAALRQSLGFAEGDRMIAREEAGRLILEKREAIARRLKARFSHGNPHRSLADELIAERREAAKEESVE